MKKSLFFVMILCMFGRFGYSQPVDEGNILIDASYGWPNLWTSFFKTAVTDASSTNVKVGSLGPISAQFEYMVSEKMGVGLVFGYSTSSVSFDDVDSGYYYDLSVTRIRIMPKFSIHFGQSDVFDPYFLLAAGYASKNYKFESDEPGYDGFSVDGISPIAFRVGFGGRYYFTDAIGAKFEIGLGGGGLLEFGLTAKF